MNSVSGRWPNLLKRDFTAQAKNQKMVQASIGLRSLELFEETAPGIMQIPETFEKVLLGYFAEMGEKGVIQMKITRAWRYSFWP